MVSFLLDCLFLMSHLYALLKKRGKVLALFSTLIVSSYRRRCESSGLSDLFMGACGHMEFGSSLPVRWVAVTGSIGAFDVF